MQLEAPDQASGKSYSSASPEKEKAIYTGKGVLNYLAVENKSGAKVYAFIYDGADHTGTLLHAPIPVESHGISGTDVRYGLEFTNGLYIGISTSDASWAATSTSDAWITAGYSPVAGGG
jgi:hypothetical protein